MNAIDLPNILLTYGGALGMAMSVYWSTTLAQTEISQQLFNRLTWLPEDETLLTLVFSWFSSLASPWSWQFKKNKSQQLMDGLPWNCTHTVSMVPLFWLWWSPEISCSATSRSKSSLSDTSTSTWCIGAQCSIVIYKTQRINLTDLSDPPHSCSGTTMELTFSRVQKTCRLNSWLNSKTLNYR